MERRLRQAESEIEALTARLAAAEAKATLAYAHANVALSAREALERAIKDRDSSIEYWRSRATAREAGQFEEWQRRENR
jgi:uncharacterized protein YcbX